MRDVTLAARTGGGPALVEAHTYRWHGHYEGDPQRYRTSEEVQEWQRRDPLRRHRDRLLEAGVSPAEIDELESSVARQLDEAVARAGALAAPSAATLFDFVVRTRPPARRAAGAAGRRRGVPHDGRRPQRARVRAGSGRAGLRRRRRRGGGGQRVRPHPGPARPVRGARPGHPDLRDGDRRARRRRSHGGDAARGGGHVPRLPGRLPRPVAQPGGQASLHDGRVGRDGADRAYPVRRRPFLGEPALAEPRGPARAHPGAHGGHAFDAGGHLRTPAKRHRGPEPGRLHREPAALRDEGTPAPGRPSRPARAVGSRPSRIRRHRGVGVAHGARRAWRRPRSSRPRASPWR